MSQQSSSAAAGASGSSSAPAQTGSSAAGSNTQSSAAATTGNTAATTSAAQSSGQSATQTTSTSFSAPSYNTDRGAFVSSTAQGSITKGLSKTAIGGLVGGIVGAIALAVIAWVIWRQCRGRGEKIPPPPPREVSYNPQFSSHRRTRSGSMSMTMSTHRASSFSTLLAAPPRASSQFYAPDSPVSTFAPDGSPRLHSHAYPSASPSLSSSGTGANTPANAPVMVPLDTPLRRDGSISTSSGSGSGQGLASLYENEPQYPRLQRPSSSDQLRAPTPSEGNTPSDGSDTRTTNSDSLSSSPRPSFGGLSNRRSLSSLPPSIRHSPHPSLSGAPHRGRHVSITVPRPLSQGSMDGMMPVTPSTAAVQRGSYHAPSLRNGYSPRTSYGDYPATQSQHRRVPSNASAPQETLDDQRFAGSEEIV